MEKGQTVELIITDTVDGGQGFGKTDGMAVFVPGAVPGDKVKAEITKCKKNYAFARLVEIAEPSKDRIESDCPFFPECGGCAYRNISYKAELRLKEKQVRDKLERIAGIKNAKVNPIITAQSPQRYRNKGSFPVSTDGYITEKGGAVKPVCAPKIGFFSRKTHSVVNVDDCLLQNSTALALAEALRRWMREDNITSYDERWDGGLMRKMVVKLSEATGEVMVILVINGKGIPDASKLVFYLETACENTGMCLESVAINRLKGKTEAPLKSEFEVLAGKSTISSECLGLKFEISPSSFYQVNTVQAARLYAKALEYADLSGTETVFDLYCGVGTIGLIASKNARYVYGIELDKGAVLSANRNAVINGIVNAQFICGRAEDEIDRLVSGYTDKYGFETEGQTPDVVIVDPPRAGCDKKLIDTIIKLSPKRLVYVSCDPATLARDIRLLCEGGFEFKEATPCDMFPRTGHVETAALLSRTEK